MATPIATSSSTLNITLNDTGGYETTLKLDNFVANVTLAQVKAAFNNLFGDTNSSKQNILYSRYKLPIVSVKSAKTVETRTVTTTLDE